MAKKAEPSRVAAALQYLQQMRDRAADFGGGVVDTLADRARDVGGLAYEAFTSDPNIGRMTTAEFAQAAAARAPTPRLDATAQGIGALGKALVTQPVQTAKAVVVDPVVEAFESPRAMGQFAGEFVNPLRIAAALRKTAPIAELDVYHGSPHRFEPTEENPLGEFDASKIGSGEGAQAYGHGIYLAESPKVAEGYKERLAASSYMKDSQSVAYGKIWQKAADAALETGAAHPDYSRAISSQIMDWVDGGRKPETFLRYHRVPPSAKPAYEAAVKEYVGLQKTPGNLYTADLPDEMIDRMLDWDKPLSEQPEIYRKVLSDKNWRKRFEFRTDEQVGELTGAELYKMGHDQTKNLGIPGIKYLDAGSRGGSGTGTRNFVVFPGEEKKVKILKRD
jgi:hypothetical protein